MKVYAFEVRMDEQEYMKVFSESLGIEVTMSEAVPSVENADLVKGYEGVTILGQGNINAELLDCWKAEGVRYISTRTIGYNHIDVAHANKIGIKVCNANYAPNGVADFTVMLMLMCLRNYKQAMWRGQVNDFSLEGLQGREMRSLTVGIMGTGRIGYAVMKNLSGFGCKILAYDVYENEKVKEYATYVDLDTFYRECDIISLHMPLLESTYHIINKESISRMKDGVMIINCARGELADTEALIKGIESCKIGALGLDVVEREEGIAHVDHRVDILSNRNMAYLRQFRNVVMTQHFGFYTDEAVKSMVECGLKGIVEMSQGGNCATQI